MKSPFLMLCLLLVSVSFNLQASEYYWGNGIYEGSNYYWDNGSHAGSKYYWENGMYAGSKYYWENGMYAGSKYYWENGRYAGSKYYWENGMYSSFGDSDEDNFFGFAPVCMGLLDEGVQLGACQGIAKDL